MGRTEIYFTHDNCGRPFRVEISGNDLKVFKGEWDYELEDVKYATNSCFEFENFNKLFVGYSPFNYITDFSGGFGDDFLGNSILVNTEGNDYVFIGNCIIRFQITEPVLDFVSPVGPNDVPYPYIETETKVYCIIEQTVVFKDGMTKFLNTLSSESLKMFKKKIAVPNSGNDLLDPYSCYVYSRLGDKLNPDEQESFKTFIKLEKMENVETIVERV